MPTYVYECACEEFELNVPISARDTVKCQVCGEDAKRKIAFTGLTWAPTAGGYR